MIKVLAAGFNSSLQDSGRLGHRAQGIPVCGWMDGYSAQLANALLNNDMNATVLEMTYQGPILEFSTPCTIAITGAQCQIWLNEKLISANRAHKLKKDDVLKIGKMTQGVYSYLAITGGFNTEKILNSYSYYHNITAQSQLKKNDTLIHSNIRHSILNQTSIKPEPNHLSCTHIRVLPGPEYYQLDAKTQTLIFKQRFRVSQYCNRMAYKLKCTVVTTAQEIITSCVQTGTVQLTPEGEFIVLMRDCQTTGGYARILQLSQDAINQLAQKAIGSQFYFQMLGND